MSDEKTIEELESELKNLRRKNLEKELAKEKAKLEKEAEEAKKLEEQKLRDEIKAQVVEEMTGESKIRTDNSNENAGKPRYAIFMEDMKEKYGLTGTPYEDLMRKISSPGNFKGERK